MNKAKTRIKVSDNNLGVQPILEHVLSFMYCYCVSFVSLQSCGIVLDSIPPLQARESCNHSCILLLHGGVLIGLEPCGFPSLRFST